jgi:oligopeptide transport system substrate-binding protein
MRSIRATSLSLLVGVLAACSSGEQRMSPPRFTGAGSQTPVRGGILRYSLVDDVRSLDPAIAFDEFSNLAEHLVFDCLLDYAPSTSAKPFELVPQLAERWEVAPDGLVYTFHLRGGIKYHDGTPIAADDFVYSLERILEPKTGSGGKQFYEGIDKLEAPDEHTLVIRLKKPDASFPLLVAMPFAAPMRRGYAEKMGDQLRSTPLASGPFKLKEWRQGERLELERNPHYWDPTRPYLDGIVMNLFVARDVQVLKFLSGELESAERLSSDQYVRFAQTPEWQPYLNRMVLMAVYGEGMDVRHPPFNDKRVRQALNYALNKDDTVVLYNGRAAPSHGIIPPGLPGYNSRLKPYPYDPAKARQLLAEAGYPNGFDVVYSTTKDELADKLAQSIQADLGAVGVRIRIENLTFPAYLEATGRSALKFFYSGWNMDFPDPWDFAEVRFHSRMRGEQNASNDTNFSNAELDATLDAARIELDPAKRAALYEHAEEILYEEAPWVWHYHPMTVEVVHPYVKGYKPHPVWLRSYRDAWLDLPRRDIR